MCGSGNRNEVYRLGLVALSLTEKARAQEMLPRVLFYFYGFINHWRHPLRSNLKHFEKTEKVGMEVGDIEYAMLP